MNEFFDILKHDDLNAFKLFNYNVVLDGDFFSALDKHSQKVNENLLYHFVFFQKKGYFPTRVFLRGIKDAFLGMAYLFNAEKIFFYLFDKLDCNSQSNVIDFFINNDLDYYPRYHLFYRFLTMLSNRQNSDRIVIQTSLMSYLWLDMDVVALNDICINKRPLIINDFMDRLNIGLYVDDIYLYNDCYIFDYLMILIQLSNSWNIKMKKSFINDFFKKYLDTDVFLLNIDKHSFYNGEEAIRHQAASALYVFMKRHGLMDNCENIMSYVIKNIRYECISNDDPVLRNKVNIYHSLQIPLLDIAKSFRADVHLTNMEYD